MRVVIVGAGAVGGYFGGRLLEAGGDVTFLVRPRRRAQLAGGGLVLNSPAGDFAAPVKTVLSEDIVAPADLVLLGCKAYDLAGAIDSFAPAVGPDTAVLPLLNGMRHLDLLVERFGEARVLGGLCSIPVTLDAMGHVRHLGDMHFLTFGERDGRDSQRVRHIAQLMAPAKFDSRPSDVIMLEMWEKWFFLATLAGITTLMRASVGDIVAAGGVDAILAMLAEAQAVAVACGNAPRPAVLDSYRGLLTAPGSTLTASMMRDVENGGAVEADHVLGDLLARGRAAGLDLPMLNLAYTHLKAYEARRASGVPLNKH